MAGELEHVLAVMCQKWQWGVTDCCSSACEVFRRINGIDPMQSIRGTYNTHKGAEKLISKMGGFLPMCETLASQAGLIDGVGESGEIGVSISGDNMPVLSVCVGDGYWAAKSKNGFVLLKNVMRSWSCRKL